MSTNRAFQVLGDSSEEFFKYFKPRNSMTFFAEAVFLHIRQIKDISQDLALSHLPHVFHKLSQKRQ